MDSWIDQIDFDEAKEIAAAIGFTPEAEALHSKGLYVHALMVRISRCCDTKFSDGGGEFEVLPPLVQEWFDKVLKLWADSLQF